MPASPGWQPSAFFAPPRKTEIVWRSARQIAFHWRYRHANGYTDINKKTEVTGKELYNIYSCSKLITCVAALQLFEKGLFKLDYELYRYMPEFKNMTFRSDNGIIPAKNKITIRQLFTMTAGFSYDLNSQCVRLSE